MSTLTMLAQIDPVLTMVQQEGLFNTQVNYITGSYMVAVAERYLLGSDKVNFRIAYGNCEFLEDNRINFQPIHMESLTISGEVVENWGEDDSIMLYEIATQQGTTVQSIISGSVEGGFF